MEAFNGKEFHWRKQVKGREGSKEPSKKASKKKGSSKVRGVG